MTEEVLANLKNRVFYHGTSLAAAERIAEEGFQAWRYDEDLGVQLEYGGNLGIGIYVSCDWRIALWFGSTLLRATAKPGTRILDAALPPDRKVLRHLEREFGRKVLTETPWKALPKNKRLMLNELVALFRYHYQKTWETKYGVDGWSWPRVRERHERLLNRFRSILIRNGFHGYGDPRDENGVVIFSGDRLELVDVIADLPEVRSCDYWNDESRQFKSLDQIRTHFRVHGSKRAKDLARTVAEAENG